MHSMQLDSAGNSFYQPVIIMDCPGKKFLSELETGFSPFNKE